MNYDAIIIGAGHNGLVAAAYLAKAGKKVVVLERRTLVGGAAATEELFSGYRVNTGSVHAGLLLPQVERELNLAGHGLSFIDTPAAVFAPSLDGPSVTIWRDIQRTVTEIARHSARDAAVFPKFVAQMERLSRILASISVLTPPEIKGARLSDLLPWLSSAVALKRLGKADMMELLRILPLSVREFMDEWFESELLKAALGAPAVAGSMLGPMAAGTVFTLMHQHQGAANGGYVSARFVKGGSGALSEALRHAAEAAGAEIRTGAEVKQIHVDQYRVHHVELADGAEVAATTILSSVDPKTTFLKLVGAPNLGPEFVRRVRNIRMRGTTARMVLALKALPRFVSAHEDPNSLSAQISICPSLEYLEQAYDDAKYGCFSAEPYLNITIPTLADNSLAPQNKQLMIITMQYAPFSLREDSWERARKALGETILSVLRKYVVGLDDLIENKHLITPIDYASTYSLSEGSIYQGQMGLDQILFYAAGSGVGEICYTGRWPLPLRWGTHPGGGVSGASGYNAARELIKAISR